MIDSTRSGLTALLVAAAFALTACGGGGGGSGSGGDGGDTDGDGTADGGSTVETTTFAGSVQVASDSTSADARDWTQRVLAFFLADTRAAIGGLQAAPDGTAVRLIRIDSDGNEVDQLDSGTVEDGRFELNTDLEVDGGFDLVIEAGAADDPVRAPAGGDEIVVSPVSLNIVNKVLARIAADENLSLDDYRAADLVALIAIIVEELDARDYTFTSASNRDAADEADAEAGDTDDELVASVEGNATQLDALAGTKNLIIQDAILEVGTNSQFGDHTRFTAIREVLNPTITADSRLELGGTTVHEAEVAMGWNVSRDPDTDEPFVSFEPIANSESFTEGEGEGFDITVGSDGRLFTSLASNVRGATTPDGQLLALTEAARDGTEGEREEFFAGIAAGASEWDPGSTVNEDFNYVLFDAYTAQDTTHAGFATTLRGEANLSCAEGADCSLTLTRSFDSGAGTRKFFAEASPGSPIDVGESSNTGTLTYEGLTLTSTGRFSGAPTIEGFESLEVEGLLAPDSRMLVAHVNGRDGRDQFQDFLIGLPAGTSCSDSTFNGGYNMVGLFGVLQADAEPTAKYGNAIRVESETSRIDADGQGSFVLSDSRFPGGTLRFNDDLSTLSSGIATDTDETIAYAVTSDCRIEITDGDGGEYVLGAVSPDGEAFVLATHETAEADQSILIGLRRAQ